MSGLFKRNFPVHTLNTTCLQQQNGPYNLREGELQTFLTPFNLIPPLKSTIKACTVFIDPEGRFSS